jgi:hypothetical protein
MALQLKHILASVRIWSGKIQSDTLIKGIASFI